MDLLQHFSVLGDLLSFYERLHRIQTVAGVIAAMDLTHTCMA